MVYRSTVEILASYFAFFILVFIILSICKGRCNTNHKKIMKIESNMRDSNKVM